MVFYNDYKKNIGEKKTQLKNMKTNKERYEKVKKKDQILPLHLLQ